MAKEILLFGDLPSYQTCSLIGDTEDVRARVSDSL